MTTLTDFTDSDDPRKIVAYAYELAKFSVFKDPKEPD